MDSTRREERGWFFHHVSGINSYLGYRRQIRRVSLALIVLFFFESLFERIQMPTHVRLAQSRSSVSIVVVDLRCLIIS